MLSPARWGLSPVDPQRRRCMRHVETVFICGPSIPAANSLMKPPFHHATSPFRVMRRHASVRPEPSVTKQDQTTRHPSQTLARPLLTAERPKCIRGLRPRSRTTASSSPRTGPTEGHERTSGVGTGSVGRKRARETIVTGLEGAMLSDQMVRRQKKVYKRS